MLLSAPLRNQQRASSPPPVLAHFRGVELDEAPATGSSVWWLVTTVSFVSGSHLIVLFSQVQRVCVGGRTNKN